MGHRGPPEVRKQMSADDEFEKIKNEFSQIVEILKYVFKHPQGLMDTLAMAKSEALISKENTAGIKKVEVIFNILKSFWEKKDISNLSRYTWDFWKTNRKELVCICVGGTSDFSLSGSMEKLEASNPSDGDYLDASNYFKFIYDLRKETGISHPGN